MKRHVHGHGRKSEKIVLDCNHAPKHNKSFKCPQKVIDNDIVFSAAKDAIIATLNTKELNEQLINKLSNLPSLDLNKEKIAKLEDLLNLKIDTLDKFVEKNANTADLDITLYNKEYNNLVNEINTIKADIASLNIEISKGLHNKSRASLIQEFIDKKAPFEEIRLLNSLLKYIIVTPANDLIMISTGSNYNLEDIVTNHEILNNSAVLIQKTHYDIDLNKNITYKLVQLND